jgi:hypothetical protein
VRARRDGAYRYRTISADPKAGVAGVDIESVMAMKFDIHLDET